MEMELDLEVIIGQFNVLKFMNIKTFFLPSGCMMYLDKIKYVIQEKRCKCLDALPKRLKHSFATENYINTAMSRTQRLEIAQLR